MGRAKGGINAIGVSGFDDVFGVHRGRVEVDGKLLVSGDDEARSRAHERMLQRYRDDGLDEVLRILRPHVDALKDSEHAKSLLSTIAADISEQEISGDQRRARERVLVVAGFQYGNDEDYVVRSRADKRLHFHLLGTAVHDLQKSDHIEVVCGDEFRVSEVDISKNNNWMMDSFRQCRSCVDIYERKTIAFGGKPIKEFDDFEISPTGGTTRKQRFENGKKRFIERGLLSAIEKADDVNVHDLDEQAYWDSALALWEMDMFSNPQQVLKTMLGDNGAKDTIKSIQDDLESKMSSHGYSPHMLLKHGRSACDEVLIHVFNSNDMQKGLEEIRAIQIETIADGNASSSDITSFSSRAAKEFRQHVKRVINKQLPGVSSQVFYSHMAHLHEQQSY